MACPSCNGTQREPIARGYWRCTSLVARTILVEDHPYPELRDALPISGLPMIEQVSYSPCGHAYQEADVATASPQPCRCGLFSIGACARCGAFTCGAHGRLVGEEFLCAEHGRAEDQARGRAARLAAQQERQAAQLARKTEMSALVGMLQAAARAPSGAGLLSLRGSFPGAAVATQLDYELGRSAVASDWPGSSLDAEGRNLVAAVAAAAASRHELVTFRARDKTRFVLGAVRERSRMPIVALPNGLAIGRDGEVLFPVPDHSVLIGRDVLTVVPRGRRVRLSGYSAAYQANDVGIPEDWSPACYRKLRPGPVMMKAAISLWGHWNDILPAMASILV
jgi:hypothetical protein